MADIDLTTTASVPSGTAITVRVYEDEDGDGSAENVASQAIGDGTNTYSLSGFAGNGSYWIEAEFDHQEVTKTAELDSARLGGVGGGKIDLSGPVEDKQALIDAIRNGVPSEYVDTKQTIDSRPQEFVNTVRPQLNDLGDDRLEQYREVFKRLNSSEEITLEAADRPIDEIVGRTGHAVVNAILSISIEVVTFGFGNATIAKRANRLIGDSLAAQGKAVNHSLIGKLGRGISHQFAKFSDDSAAGFGRITEDYFYENRRAYQNGLTQNQKRTLVDTIKEESIHGAVNAVKFANEVSPDGLITELEDFAEDVRTEIESLFFAAYWFAADLEEYEFSAPEIEIPDTLDFTFDLPLFESPFVDDDVTVSVNIDSEQKDQAKSGVDALENAVNDAIEFLDLAENVYGDTSGIEATLTDTTEILVEDANDGLLQEQNDSDREAVRSIGVDGIRKGTDAASAVLDIIGKLLDGIMYLSIAIGLAAIIIWAIAAIASALGGVTAPLILPETGLLLTILGILSVVDVILVLSRVAVLGRVLQLIGKFHFATVTSINLIQLDGGSA